MPGQFGNHKYLVITAGCCRCCRCRERPSLVLVVVIIIALWSGNTELLAALHTPLLIILFITVQRGSAIKVYVAEAINIFMRFVITKLISSVSIFNQVESQL